MTPPKTRTARPDPVALAAAEHAGHVTTTHTTALDAETALARAEQEAAEAEQLAEALAEKVREGDDTIDHEQLSTAEKLRGFVKLRLEAAARKLVKAQQEARDAALAQIRHDVEHYAEPGNLPERAAAVLAALGHLVDAVDVHNTAMEGLRGRLRDLGIVPTLLRKDPEAAKRDQDVRVHQSTRRIHTPEGEVGPLDAGLLVERIVREFASARKLISAATSSSDPSNGLVKLRHGDGDIVTRLREKGTNA